MHDTSLVIRSPKCEMNAVSTKHLYLHEFSEIKFSWAATSLSLLFLFEVIFNPMTNFTIQRLQDKFRTRLRIMKLEKKFFIFSL